MCVCVCFLSNVSATETSNDLVLYRYLTRWSIDTAKPIYRSGLKWCKKRMVVGNRLLQDNVRYGVKHLNIRHWRTEGPVDQRLGQSGWARVLRRRLWYLREKGPKSFTRLYLFYLLFIELRHPFNEANSAWPSDRLFCLCWFSKSPWSELCDKPMWATTGSVWQFQSRWYIDCVYSRQRRCANKSGSAYSASQHVLTVKE